MGNFKIENYWENQLKNLNVNEFEQNKNFIQSLQNFLSNDSFHSRVFSKSTPENITTKLTESYVRACTLMSTIPEFVGLTTTEQEKVKTALTLEWYYYGYAIGKTKVDQTIKVLLDGGTMDQALQNSPNVYAFYSTWSNQKLEEHATEIKQELSATPAYIDNTQKKDSTNSTESISPEFVAEQLFHAPEEDGTLYHATNGNSNISQERPSSLNQEWVASPDTIKPKITEEDLPQLYWTEAPKETPEPKQKTETLYLLNSVTNTRHFELMLFDIKSSREYNRGEVSINYDSNGWLHIHVPQPPTRKGDANLTVYDYIIDQKTLNSFGAQKLLENLSE